MSEIRESSVDFAELGQYRLGWLLQRARLLGEASRSETPAPEAVDEAWTAFCKRNHFDPQKPGSVPREYFGCPADALRGAVERDVRLQMWKEATFGFQAEERFHQRKPALDRVVYSLLRVQEAGLARELWFRLREGEATFADLAPRYASGNEVYTGGIVGPVAYGSMHPGLANALRVATAGEVLKPFAVAEWHLVARVEHHLPAVFEESTRTQMIDELLQIWLEERETHV